MRIAWTHCHVYLSRAREPMGQHDDEGPSFLSGISPGIEESHAWT